MRSTLEPQRPRERELDVVLPAPRARALCQDGRVVRLGRRLTFAEAEVSDATGAPKARGAQVTIAVSPLSDAQ